MTRYKCLSCSRVISDKSMHTRRTEPPHQKYIQIGIDGEEELSETQRWTKELIEDEQAGVKTIRISLQVFSKIKEITNSQEADHIR